MKRKLYIGILISAVFLFLAMRKIEWNRFGEVMQRTNYLYALAGGFSLMMGHYVRAYRWKFVLSPIRTMRTWNLFSATAIGLAFNNILPARLGEVVRAVAVARAEGISKSAAFATIVYERVVDVFSLLALLWLTLLKVDGPAWLQRSGVALVILNVALLLLLYFMVQYQRRFMRVLETLVKPLPDRLHLRVYGWAEAFIDGLAVLRSKNALWSMTITSVGVWGAAAFGNYFCVLALHLDVPIMASVVLVVLVSLGTMIPAAPAYVGPVQYACILGLGIYGIPESDAFAYSILFHVSHFVPITTTGLFFAWRSHIHISDATRKGQGINGQTA